MAYQLAQRPFRLVIFPQRHLQRMWQDDMGTGGHIFLVQIIMDSLDRILLQASDDFRIRHIHEVFPIHTFRLSAGNQGGLFTSLT